MCRIAGLVDKSLSAEELLATVTIMCDSLKHGGPDDSGVYCDAATKVCLGNRRLAIVDLTANGHQPMADANQTTWLTFNGEIYNYQELRSELASLGVKFHSNTDTEIVLQAYINWGTESFARLKGMFAFAVYDAVKKSVYLVRDTNGIKPLYYSTAGNKLAFASEIRAFKAAKLNNSDDPRWPVWLLALGHIPEPHTTLKDVQSLPKGHFLCWSENGSFLLEQYFTKEKISYISNEKIIKQEVFGLMSQAVQRQLVADASIGVFLSGGIDSSLITLLAANNDSERLNTISVFFDEKNYDERAYQNAITQIANCNNHKHLVQQQDFDAHLIDILGAMDMPTTDGINTWFISKYAHEAGLKAVLSGVGADELFGGYPSFNRMKYLPYGKLMPKWASQMAGMIDGRYKKFEYLRYNHPMADYLFLRGLHGPAQIAEILDTSEAEVTGILFNENRHGTRAYDKEYAAWLETNLYMQNQLLRDTDVLSMSHGLEVRVPFLDEELMAFVEQIDPSIRFGGRQPKQILIEAFASMLPKAIWDRPKMGFTFPLQRWMRNNKHVSDESLYRGKAAKKIMKKFQSGTLHWSRAFALYQVQAHV